MMTNDSTFCKHEPLSNPVEDLFGYDSLARNIENGLRNRKLISSYSISLCGKWGVGKTTLLNFIKYYVNNNNVILKGFPRLLSKLLTKRFLLKLLSLLYKHVEKSSFIAILASWLYLAFKSKDNIIVVDFNPWWFSNNNFISEFFKVLFNKLGKFSRIRRWIRRSGSNFIDAISSIPVPGASAAKAIKGFIKRDYDLSNEKKKLEKLICNNERRFLVIFDDIDRLTANEIESIFSLIKSVADLPYLTYLLAFDKDYVIFNIENNLEKGRGRGKEYLDKIIQLYVEIPEPNEFSIYNKLFIKELNNIVSKEGKGLIDEKRTSEVLISYIYKFLDSPRKAVNLLNDLAFTYPNIAGELNFADFVCIEAIKLFNSDMYNLIKYNKEHFTGIIRYGLDVSSHDYERSKEFHEEWKTNIYDGISKKDADNLINVVSLLFPKVKSALTNLGYDSSYISEWRKNRKICTDEFFDYYFILTIPEDILKINDLDRIVESTKDKKMFSQMLMEFKNKKSASGMTLLSEVLVKMDDYLEDMLVNSKTIINTYFDVGDKLYEEADQTEDFYFGNNPQKFSRIVWHLLNKIENEEDRFEILKEAIVKGNSVGCIVHDVFFFGQQHGFGGVKPQRTEEQRFVTLEHYKELEQIALEKIRKIALTDAFMDNPCLNQMLWRWNEWSESKDEVIKFVKSKIKDGKRLLEFLSGFIVKSQIVGAGERRERTYYRLKSIEDIIDVEETNERLSKMKDDVLSPKERETKKLYIEGYKMYKEGKDPSNLW